MTDFGKIDTEGNELMGRYLRRVPLDFDWPLGTIWSGCLPPELPPCPACQGNGRGPFARALFLQSRTSDPQRWTTRISQDEVDFLVSEGHFPYPKGEWTQRPILAEQVNVVQDELRHPLSLYWTVDSLIKRRCHQRHTRFECQQCGGGGKKGTPAELAAYETWKPTYPPEGGGWQVWDSTSEGSPESPVFASESEAADWMRADAVLHSMTAGVGLVYDGEIFDWDDTADASHPDDETP